MIRLRAMTRPDSFAERAAARGMDGQYVSVLTRAHLRSLARLPKEELLGLKRASRSSEALSNLNQICACRHQGQLVSSPGRDDLKAMLTHLEALRDH